LIPRKSSGGKGSDDFEGRLVVGPFFLVVFDIYLVASIVLMLMLAKKNHFILEAPKKDRREQYQGRASSAGQRGDAP
jgi:hypothetical protein